MTDVTVAKNGIFALTVADNGGDNWEFDARLYVPGVPMFCKWGYPDQKSAAQAGRDAVEKYARKRIEELQDEIARLESILETVRRD